MINACKKAGLELHNPMIDDIIYKYKNYLYKGWRLNLPYNIYIKINNFFEQNEVINEIYISLYDNNKLNDSEICFYTLSEIRKKLYNNFIKTTHEINKDIDFEEIINKSSKSLNEKIIEEIVDFVNNHTINETLKKYNLPKDNKYLKKLLSNVSLRKNNNRRDKIYVKVDKFTDEEINNLEKSIKSRALKRGYYFREHNNNDKLFNEKIKKTRKHMDKNQTEFCSYLKNNGIIVTRERLSLIESNKSFFSISEMNKMNEILNI